MISKRSDRRPVVGVLAARMRSGLDLLDKVATTYTDAVLRAGGVPVILPNAGSCLDAYLEAADGLLLIGGTQDVDPAVYGRTNEASRETDRAKDDLEIALVRNAVGRNLPILGICRGMQIVNVAFGGTLVQDVENVATHLDYPRQDEPVHPVRIAGSAILPDGVYAVNSIHHQAVGTPGAGMVVTGMAPDGVIESIEHPRHAVLGVQWHPECLREDPLSDRLFSWLVSGARSRP